MNPRGRTLDVGARFGRLTVVSQRNPGERNVLCRCDCGAAHIVHFKSWGSTMSCGCLRRDSATERATLHGRGRTTEYVIWKGMRQRCLNPRNPAYPRYGGRGISICKRWDDFEAFYADMGPRPEGRTLDRIDNECGYEPGNCRWATAVEQRQNRRTGRPRKRASHCKRGHERTPQTVDGDGRCRACTSLRQREARLRAKGRDDVIEREWPVRTVPVGARS